MASLADTSSGGCLIYVDTFCKYYTLFASSNVTCMFLLFRLLSIVKLIKETTSLWSSVGGCAVIKGNKWSSTKWMRVHEYKI